ncbi:dethiobiotin synthase [Tissierella praeacuta]|uniref:dethiobiotin synthase n=1 Tax=Tissierella praeacuta TaxID=43131 RepID=UPI0028A74C1D|nr:dethiobiotin synthase [Tissierella praeacuta]
MSRGIFVTATGTDIGKTYVTALIVKKLREAGYNAGYYKSVLSGAEMTKNGLYIGDAYHVKTIANLNCDCVDMISYVYETSVSPHLAAKLEGNPVILKKIVTDYKKQCSRYDYITVEGSGGIICPIRYDSEHQIFLEDIIKELKLSVLIVAEAGLGTINSTVLTVRYLENNNIQIKGIILNRYHGDIMEDDNIKMIEEITHIPVIALIRDGDSNIDIDVHMLAGLYGKDGN